MRGAEAVRVGGGGCGGGAWRGATCVSTFTTRTLSTRIGARSSLGSRSDDLACAPTPAAAFASIFACAASSRALATDKASCAAASALLNLAVERLFLVLCDAPPRAASSSSRLSLAWMEAWVAASSCLDGRSNAVKSATLVGARLSPRGGGWPPSGGASPGSAQPPRAARRALGRHRGELGHCQGVSCRAASDNFACFRAAWHCW